jgi:hypothetical protein
LFLHLDIRSVEALLLQLAVDLCFPVIALVPTDRSVVIPVVAVDLLGIQSGYSRDAQLVRQHCTSRQGQTGEDLVE